MKKHPRKIFEQMSFILAAMIVTGGIFVLFTAPGQELSERQQLQLELQENAQLLEKQFIGEDTTMPSPSNIPEEGSAGIMPEESPHLFTAIGDSVLLGAASTMKEKFPGCIIDAEEGRQVWDVGEVVEDLEAKGKLLNTVVIALGANGSFSKISGQDLIDLLGHERRIYWIAPYGKNLYWKDSTLEILWKIEDENENVTVLNWPERAAQHDDWFYEDGIHLNNVGQIEYAQYLDEIISADNEE